MTIEAPTVRNTKTKGEREASNEEEAMQMKSHDPEIVSTALLKAQHCPLKSLAARQKTTAQDRLPVFVSELDQASNKRKSIDTLIITYFYSWRCKMRGFLYVTSFFPHNIISYMCVGAGRLPFVSCLRLLMQYTGRYFVAK